MPFVIRSVKGELAVELKGGITIRHAQELGKCLAASFVSGTTVSVVAAEVDDIDTSILQLLVSLRKTASGFVLKEVSEAFVSAVDRCALRRELLAGAKETQ